MDLLLDTGAPAALAECRRAGTVSRLPLHKLASRTEAARFQAAAVRALGGVPCGHKIGATSREVQNLLNCRQPIHAPILCQDVLASGATFRIPAGLLGVECEFGFLMGDDFPTSTEMPDIIALRSAVAECFVALELVGRRVVADVPLNEVSSIADFALDVAVVRGDTIPDWDRQDLAAIPVRAVLDGVTVVSGSGAMVLGHPLNALLWLAEALHVRGDRLRSGEIILTGTCTGHHEGRSWASVRWLLFRFLACSASFRVTGRRIAHELCMANAAVRGGQSLTRSLVDASTRP